MELRAGLGLAADYRMSHRHRGGGRGGASSAARSRRSFRARIFFAGKLIFEQERWYQRFLHNETAYQIQRRLQFAGLNAMVLPVRVLEATVR